MKNKTLSDNEKIELARQSGYNEACYIKNKRFEKFISNLKAQLHGRLFLYKMTLDDLNLRSHEKVRLINECVDKLADDELANHSTVATAEGFTDPNGNFHIEKVSEDTHVKKKGCGKPFYEGRLQFFCDGIYKSCPRCREAGR